MQLLNLLELRSGHSDTQTNQLLNSLLHVSSLPGMLGHEQMPMGDAMVVDPSGDLFGDYDHLKEGDFDLDARSENEDQDKDDEELDDEDEGYGFDDDEEHWEPYNTRTPSPELVFPVSFFDEPLQLPQSRVPHITKSVSSREPYVVSYPDASAGAPIDLQMDIIDENTQYLGRVCQGEAGKPWAPFDSKIDWKIAYWAKLRGPSSTALTELLAIEGVCDKLGLSYWNASQLNAIIDKSLPSVHPKFQRQEVVVQGQAYKMYFRDILECVKSLYGDAEFAEYLKFMPEHHYKDSSCKEQLYHDMHTGQWWWSMQMKLDEHIGSGRTVIPVIISSDKTQVTLFRNKAVYPVCMTIGNIPKELRRKPSRRAYVLPLEEVGATGLILASGDGIKRHRHPIFAAHVGDYPEQVLVACCITGHCPRCTIPRQQIGENTEPHPLRHLRSILEALQMADQGASVFVRACQDAGIKPAFEPFWAKLPYSNIYMAITPDILHQLYQGVFKHMKSWVIEAFGAHEIDAHCRWLPPNHNICIFIKGISSLQRVSGEEHAQMSHFLLGLVAKSPLPNGMSTMRLVRCLRGLVDFLYLAQYPVQLTKTLRYVSDALDLFHANKQIFIDLGIRSDFHIPKIHFMNHYVECITHMGTPDNFNTEYTERLHIDLAKDAYRATNKKDELLQMTLWLERKEKVTKHAAYLKWVKSGKHPPLRSHWILPGLNTPCTLKMTKHPSVYTVKIADVIQQYGATFFKAALARFITQLKQPLLSGPGLDDTAENPFLGVSHVSAYHRVKYARQDTFTGSWSTADSLHVQPARKGKYGHTVPGRFDTALVRVCDPVGPLQIKQDTWVGQVRIVFTLPPKVSEELFCNISPSERPHFLAYVEWFMPFQMPDPNHGLFKVARCNVEGGQLASVVNLERVMRSVHLIPRFGSVANREWESNTVLDDCHTFFVNSYSNRHMYQLFASYTANYLHTGI
ncbi:hypothetical protein DFH05DRAFT_1588862 [Lentinula detonsa]|uniref:Uncharacterized protein n=1 Tax=Lentinula detonsa TaxID=2804962 RepID=A0A9W8P7G4_9AGAR|nr:hypothetical protein DFH05DRAFT_1588862 [Lentinula detonsa]